METKEKNKKLLIVVGVLLLFGGVSLAYFVSKILTNGNGGNTSVTTAVINGATVNVEGVLSFEDLDILPGHKSVSSIKVTATGNNELIPYNLIWQGTNTLTTPLNFTIYKTSERIEVKATCEDKSKMIGASKAIYEECNISNIDRLGTEIVTGVINKNDSKVILAKDEFITATSTGDIKYYYVILEYPNLDEPQNYDLEGSIEGEVTVEESNIKPDINILAAYVAQEDGTYKEVDDIPQSGYTVNQEKSTCSNGAIPVGNTPDITVKGLTKSGTSCYLYFDKYIPPTGGEAILVSINRNYIKEGNPDFTINAKGSELLDNNGIYKTADPMYGGESYYWRGAATSNHMMFDNKCWRIVRINGDGSIRLIYNGSPSGTAPNQTCAGNGSSVGIVSGKYNSASGNASYVGYTYTLSRQRPIESNEISSTAKTQLETWFDNNINEEALNKIDMHGKFCNDREVADGYTWAATGKQFNYAATSRLKVNPTLSCPSEDIYNLKIGLITADEVVFAGGKISNGSNTSYYLYNGKDYWTMTPSGLRSDNVALNYYVRGSDGWLIGYLVGSSDGLRPVINLKNSINFTGIGSPSNPYVVVD